MEVYGHEALSKFDIKNEIINTEEIFRKLHHNNKLLFELEKRNKKLQIENYPLKQKNFFLILMQILLQQKSATLLDSIFNTI